MNTLWQYLYTKLHILRNKTITDHYLCSDKYIRYKPVIINIFNWSSYLKFISEHKECFGGPGSGSTLNIKPQIFHFLPIFFSWYSKTIRPSLSKIRFLKKWWLFLYDLIWNYMDQKPELEPDQEPKICQCTGSCFSKKGWPQNTDQNKERNISDNSWRAEQELQ